MGRVVARSRSDSSWLVRVGWREFSGFVAIRSGMAMQSLAHPAKQRLESFGWGFCAKVARDFLNQAHDFLIYLFYDAFVCCNSKGVANRARIRRAVRHECHARYSQKRRSAIFGLIERPAHFRKLPTYEQVRDTPSDRVAKKRAHVCHGEFGESFHGLEGDVASKAVGYDNVRLKMVYIAPLDVTDVIDMPIHLAQNRCGRPCKFGSL